VEEDVEIARRRAERPRLALAGSGCGCRYRRRREWSTESFCGLSTRPSPRQERHGFSITSPRPAGRAGALDHEEALLRADLAMAAAQVQRRVPVPGSRPNRAQGSHCVCETSISISACLAVERLVEVISMSIAQVGAAPRLLAPPPPPKALPKIDSKISPMSPKPPPAAPPPPPMPPFWNAAWPNRS
jgi:hypothetical protein